MKVLAEKLFGLGERKHQWNELNITIKRCIIKDFLVNIGIITVFSVLFIMTRVYDIIFLGVICLIFGLVASYHKLLLFEYEHYVTINGTCVKIDKPQKKTFLGNTYGKCTAIIKVDEMFFEIIIPFSMQVTVGSQLCIYTNSNAIMQKIGNTYTISTSLLIEVQTMNYETTE